MTWVYKIFHYIGNWHLLSPGLNATLSCVILRKTFRMAYLDLSQKRIVLCDIFVCTTRIAPIMIFLYCRCVCSCLILYTRFHIPGSQSPHLTYLCQASQSPLKRSMHSSHTGNVFWVTAASWKNISWTLESAYLGFGLPAIFTGKQLCNPIIPTF